MAVLVSLLASYWRPLVLGAAILAALVYRDVILSQRDAARARVRVLSLRVRSLEASARSLEEAIRRQNDAVGDLRRQALKRLEQRRKREVELKAAAERSAGSALKRAAGLKSAAIAAGCGSAIRWGNQRAAELARW